MELFNNFKLLFLSVWEKGILGVDIFEILIPFILSFITAFLALKVMIRYIYVFGFTPYVIYRIFLGIILLFIAYS